MVVKKAEELWITNICREQAISIGDLRLSLGIGQSVNLLAKKKNGKPRYQLTKELIEKSRTSGSLFKKRHFIKVREVAPVVFNHHLDIVGTEKTGPVGRVSTRLQRNPTEIEEQDFPDLDFEEDDDDRALEQFAAENADADFADRKPLLAVDPKFKKPTVDDE